MVCEHGTPGVVQGEVSTKVRGRLCDSFQRVLIIYLESGCFPSLFLSCSWGFSRSMRHLEWGVYNRGTSDKT